MPVSLANVSAGYGRELAIRNVNVTINEGEILGVFGHNGAGKSTMLRVLAGVIPARLGAFETNWGAPGESARLAYVPQDGIVFPRLTVRENILIGLWNIKVPKPDLTGRLDWIAELFPALPALFAQDAGTLSGGEKRMVALARGLIGRPDVLLVDEPSVGLSPALVQRVLKLLEEIRETSSTAVVLVEQSVSAALKIVDRFYVMRQGEVVSEHLAAPYRDRPITELYSLV